MTDLQVANLLFTLKRMSKFASVVSEAHDQIVAFRAERDELLHDLERIKAHETALVNEVEALRAQRLLWNGGE